VTPLRTLSVLVVACVSTVVLLAQSTELRVVTAGPAGEIQQLDQAREIRIVFSEPMVALGRIPSNPVPEWIRIDPAIKGTFRWSGTTTLIFTPDPAVALPFATRYRVQIAAGATSAAGRRLAAPYEFTFTTPTVKLESVRWGRRGGRVTDPVTLELRFNQPVRASDVLAHVTGRYRPQEFSAPQFTAAERARLNAEDPDGLRVFDAKVADARRNAARTDAVGLRAASEWDKTRFRQSDREVMLETISVPPPGTTLQIVLDARMPSLAGAELPGAAQSSSMPLAPVFFATGVSCRAECEPSYGNQVQFSLPVASEQFAKAFRATDITGLTGAGAGQPVPVSRTVRSTPRDVSESHSVEDAGLDPQPPARTWVWRLARTLEAEDGQILGYPWLAIVENWNALAFTSFGDGHGLWESAGGATLPFYARNITSVTERVVRVAPTDLVPRLVALEKDFFRFMPPAKGVERRLPLQPNAIQSHGLNLEPHMGDRRTGIFWAGLTEGEPIARSRLSRRERSTLVQVTNLGITVKDSPQSTLVFVTRLDNGEPVSGASVSLISTANRTLWRGRTNREGIAMAPALPLRSPDSWYELAFIATAQKDDDFAYVASNWNEGISPWDFDAYYDLWQATDILRGSVFTDRGVYRLGESVQFKLIVRADTPRGVELLRRNAPLDIQVFDARNKEVDRRTVRLSRWSSAEWTWAVPVDGTLGQYRIEASVSGGPGSDGRSPGSSDPGTTPAWLKRIGGGFLVAAYRRPDFEVRTTLTADRPLAGATLAASASANYLFGGTMAGRPLAWSLTRTGEPDAIPAPILERFPREQYRFSYYPDRPARELTRLAGAETTLPAGARFTIDLPTDRDVDLPYRYTFEADVEDLSRQHIANRASVLVHPASFYLGVRTSDDFATTAKGLSGTIVAADPSGQPVPGVSANIAVIRQQWNSIRRATGDGFYEWDVERIETSIGAWPVTTGEKPVPFTVPILEGGSYVLRVTARDAEGRRARTDVHVYVMGPGYTAWQRFDHNRIELEPERRTWKPGETARVLIKSPWERATALLTVEREGIRQHRRFTLTSTQQTVDVPITADDIPNVFVSVLLIRGRTSQDAGADGSDPGRPQFRLGYTELRVADESKQLAVKVTADRDEYRPANAARVTVSVSDHAGRPARSEVTLWAVDQGILALTDYQPPDVAGSVYERKALQVMNSDNRQRLISRRVLTPKGGDEGGGGGAEMNARADFRPLAFWLGSVETNRGGTATRTVTLPDTLTTYRIIAVAGDTESRFGSGTASLRVTQPITLTPAFPRFLALSDRASFGALVGNTQAAAADATVTVASLTPALLEFQGETTLNTRLEAGATTIARFDAIARGVGAARVRVSVTAGSHKDAFEMSIPVGAPSRLVTTAAFGDTDDRRVEQLSLPAGVAPGAGGLTLELASTALAGLGEGARYLVDYPYGCAEQKASAALALALAADLGQAFSLGQIAPAEYRTRAQSLLNELPRFQCSDGGFGFWPGACANGNFYLTSWVLHVMQVTSRLGFAADAATLEPALNFLEQQLRREPPPQIQWIPAWASSAAFAVKVLTEHGRTADPAVTRLAGQLDRMPVFALSYLADAMAAATPRHPQYVDVVRRVLNGVRVEGNRAIIQELDSDALQWLWNSNVRTSAIVLDGLVRRGDDATFVAPLVRGLLGAREHGRWSNTQENATALESLVSYYRRYESEAPDFSASVTLAGREVAKAAFRGRSAATQAVRLAMPDLLRLVTAGADAELAFSRQGTGRLYYTARLQYASSAPLPETDQGIRLERRYARVNDAGEGPAATSFAAGDLVRVTLTITLPQERRYVAVTDPLAAGFEAVDGWFNTTRADLARDASTQSSDASFDLWWRRGGFDYIEKHDDRVALFATRLSAGRHEFSYVVRAITSGTFSASGTFAEEMYAPEVHGRGAPARITIK
jgi:uncharacterized protein YfaS (alpha-2-macroglobulin family)